MDMKKIYAQSLYKELGAFLSLSELEKLIETPTYETQGDLAFPCFVLAKQFRKSPALIASELSATINHSLIEKVKADGPYLNVFFNKKAVSEQVLKHILTDQQQYGSTHIGKGKTMTIDFSSPNIAKPFSMGHLRSTVIGQTLSLIAEKCGFDVVKINHIGDWGTQFGKLIVAYKKWGDKARVRAQPIMELFELYVRFHQEAERHPELEQEARDAFKQLEDGDEASLQLWTWFRDASLQEFKRIYDLLGVSFDSYHGEAFYNDKMADTIQELENKNLLTESDGAEVVELTNEELPPCLIKKSDGATLYATRDLTAARYRKETYDFDKMVYVVGHEQRLHFQQVFAVLDKMGYDWARDMVHVPFGFILKDGRKMSTRKGKVVLLEDVLKEAIQLAKKNIETKNPNLANKDDVAHAVGVGAVIFHDLKHERNHNIEFDLEDMLTFEGSTGPYVQYTHARACSILRKAGRGKAAESFSGLTDSYSFTVIKKMLDFPHAVTRALKDYEASHIAKLLLELARAFNQYYSQVKILQNDSEMNARLALVQSVTIVLSEGLRLLGMKAPQEM
ncbi:MAG TPA: arginine--tRNA ligase [Cerasibacillus sp.]|uniref:arginine--tRNA ligase n=1 Tax=Cerasibacillus sp. TaxID=2498711 RepID=UPI002F3E4DA8